MLNEIMHYCHGLEYASIMHHFNFPRYIVQPFTKNEAKHAYKHVKIRITCVDISSRKEIENLPFLKTSIRPRYNRYRCISQVYSILL